MSLAYNHMVLATPEWPLPLESCSERKTTGLGEIQNLLQDVKKSDWKFKRHLYIVILSQRLFCFSKMSSSFFLLLMVKNYDAKTEL